MSLRNVILTALTGQRLSGYEITKEFDLVLGNFWRATHQQVYRELAALADAGLVAFETEAQSGKPDRKLYEVTAAGRQALEAWIAEPTPPAGTKNALLVKLYAGNDPAVLRGQIAVFKRQASAALAAFAAVAAEHYPEPVDQMPDWKKRAWLTLRYGVVRREADLAWAREAEGLLRDMA